MKKIQISLLAFILFAVTLGSCKKYLDINTDPNRIPASNPPMPQLLTNAQINMANDAGGDFWRYSGLITQYISGQASSPNQTFEYGRYNITGSDNNNLFGNVFSNTLSDLELVIITAKANGSPHYSGVAKILKAYQYHIVVDTWGDVPFTEALQLAVNRSPKYDKAEDIYKNLIILLNEGIAEVNATTSTLSPGSNSLMYTQGTFNAAARLNWTKLANTLKLRLFLHYSKKEPAFMVSQMNALITSGGPFFTSNADDFQFFFRDEPSARNPYDQFERARSNYLFADSNIVSIMNMKNDPRRSSYFTAFPYTSNTFKGIKPGDPATVNYSRIHTYLRGAVVGTPPASAFNPQGGIFQSTSIVYKGDAPVRMVTYPEYCFIRAEAALRGVGPLTDAQLWYTRGITASMEAAGVAAAGITTYLAINGTLIGTPASQIGQVISEKYIALNGVAVEAWTDYRRTGFPSLVVPSNAVETAVPRSLFYPQSEIDLNPNNPGQRANQQARVFWDTP